MFARLIPLIFAFATLISSLPVIHANEARMADHVFIISFDGGKPAGIKESQMPHFMQMARDGAHSWTAETIMPSLTLPSHTSMLTGVQPIKHGVFWNRWEPVRGLIKRPTCFHYAKQAGLTTAVFVGKYKFHHMDVPGDIDHFGFAATDAEMAEHKDNLDKVLVPAVRVAKDFAQTLGQFKPNLCFIHFPDPDTAGHAYGWGSEEQKQALAQTDIALDIVESAIRKSGLIESSVIILTADHGGHEKTHGTDSADDIQIPWVAYGKNVKAGLELKQPISTCDTTATALWLLGVDRPADMDGKPVKEAFQFRE